MKSVLLIEDHPAHQRDLMEAFGLARDPYVFDVTIAATVDDAVDRLRESLREHRYFDVIILDVELIEGSGDSGGLKLNLRLAIAAEFGVQTVRIVYTGVYRALKDCVDAMRHGAWDYLDRLTDPPRAVVASAISRLQQLDIRQNQEKKIAEDWLPANYYWLEERFAGKLIALWHEPNVHFIRRHIPDHFPDDTPLFWPADECLAVAEDAFELEQRLSVWRAAHRQPWEQPFLLQIPQVPEVCRVEDSLERKEV